MSEFRCCLGVAETPTTSPQGQFLADDSNGEATRLDPGLALGVDGDLDDLHEPPPTLSPRPSQGNWGATFYKDGSRVACSPMVRQKVGTDVEGVSRFTQNSQTEDVEARQLAADSAAPAEQTTVIAPGCDGQR